MGSCDAGEKILNSEETVQTYKFYSDKKYSQMKNLISIINTPH
jgi:hypothetical protein